MSKRLADRCQCTLNHTLRDADLLPNLTADHNQGAVVEDFIKSSRGAALRVLGENASV
jgi:hypothetical protein